LTHLTGRYFFLLKNLSFGFVCITFSPFYFCLVLALVVNSQNFYFASSFTHLFSPCTCIFLQVLENKEYSLADTYPRYLVLPALMTKDEIRVAAGMHIIVDKYNLLIDVSGRRCVGAPSFLCTVHRPHVVWLLLYSDFSFCSPFFNAIQRFHFTQVSAARRVCPW